MTSHWLKSLATVAALALVAGGASAATQISDLGQTVTALGGVETFDLDEDGTEDLGAVVETGSRLPFEDPFETATLDGILNVDFLNNRATELLFFADATGTAQTFNNGDSISSSADQRFTSSVELYDILAGVTAPGALLAEAGASVVLGFKLTIGTPEIIYVARDVVLDLDLDPIRDPGLSRPDYEFGTITSEAFGFLEITRGSIGLGVLGLNATGGPAVVQNTSSFAAPVPVPASALLLLAGIGGFGLMRRKRAAV